MGAIWCHQKNIRCTPRGVLSVLVWLFGSVVGSVVGLAVGSAVGLMASSQDVAEKKGNSGVWI